MLSEAAMRVKVGGVASKLKPDPKVIAQWELKIAGMTEMGCVLLIKRMREKAPGGWNVNTRCVYGMLRNRIRWFKEQRGVVLRKAYEDGQENDARAAEKRILALSEVSPRVPYPEERKGALGGRPAWAGELAERQEWARQQRAQREGRRHW